MSRPDLAYPTDEKPTFKLMQIVLRHVYLLMGFNQHEKMFQFSSGRIRQSSVFNGFLANLPQFLDQNHEMGATDTLFNFIIQLLVYSPYPGNTVPASMDIMQNTSYSLWYLEVQVRRNWLMALLVVLYKYNLNSIQEPLLTSLIRIVMNSLEAQFHQCRRIPTTILVQDLPRRAEVNQPLFGSEADEKEIASQSQMKTPGGFKKPHDSSIECDDTESELVAIPESDLSDSTLQGSIDGGMSDEIVPLKSDLKKKPGEQSDDSKKVTKPLPKSQSSETTKSLSEGVRMMFSSAILSPPVNVQKAIVVTQSHSIRPVQSTSKDTCVSGTSTSQMMATVATNQFRTISAVAGEKQKVFASPQNGNCMTRRSISPGRALGRQQRIIDTNGTSPSQITYEDYKKNSSGYVKNIERRSNYFGSPESPLSRMDLMSPPDLSETTDGLISPSSVKLEIPTPERLLPIGNISKDGVSSLVERVREALSIPDISHLKSQDNLNNSPDSPGNSSRAMSPRKLTKQSALIESPPSANQVDYDRSSIKKAECKNDPNMKDDKNHKKVGPFTIPNTECRSRYAGSWAPESMTDDEYDDNDDDASMRANYVRIEFIY